MMFVCVLSGPVDIYTCLSYCKLHSSNSVHFVRYFSYRSQITFHPNDHSAFQDLADEIKAFEGLAHDSLVKYYGCEVHRVGTKRNSF